MPSASPSDLVHPDVPASPVTPRILRWAMAYGLALTLSTVIAAVTDWRDAQLGVPGADILMRLHVVLALMTGLATAALRWRHEGALALRWWELTAAVVAAPLTLWANYHFAYPLLWRA